MFQLSPKSSSKLPVTYEELEQQWQLGALSYTALFNVLFSDNLLYELFYQSFARTTGKGIDRLNGFQYAMRAADELATASAKCIAGSYRLAPYLEVASAQFMVSKYSLPSYYLT